jgi:hypothetical protein
MTVSFGGQVYVGATEGERKRERSRLLRSIAAVKKNQCPLSRLLRKIK